MAAKRHVAPDKPATFALHEPMHCLAPGLFRSLSKIEAHEGRKPLDVAYAFGKRGESVRFTGLAQPGVDDLRVLQILVAHAGIEPVRLAPEPKTQAGRALRTALELEDAAKRDDAVMVSITRYRLIADAGWCDTKSKRERLGQSLHRLASVTVKIESGGGEWSSRLLSHALDADSGMLQVALNGRIAGAILGTGRYVRISLDEVRALKSDPARLLHQRLCAIVDEARSQSFGLRTLCDYIWPAPITGLNFDRMTDKRRNRLLTMSEEELEALEISNTAAAWRKRSRTMRAALNEIDDLDGWSVREMRKGLYKIGRRLDQSLPKDSTRLARESVISANRATTGTF